MREFKDTMYLVKILALVIIAALVVSGCAVEPKKPIKEVLSCIAPSYPFAKLEAVAARYKVEWAVFNTKNRDIIIAYYNAINNTNVNPDIIGIYADKSSSQVMLVMIKNSCVIGVSDVSIELLYTLITGKYI